MPRDQFLVFFFFAQRIHGSLTIIFCVLIFIIIISLQCKLSKSEFQLLVFCFAQIYGNAINKWLFRLLCKLFVIHYTRKL